MTYRNIDTSIWKDEWFLDLEPDEKLLFIYLFSNENTTLTGLYKINLKVIEFETGLSKDFIAIAMAKFASSGKVYFENNIIWVFNLRKYNQSRSPKVDARITWELKQIPDCKLKSDYLQAYNMVSVEYQYSTDTMMTLTNQSKPIQTSTSAARAFAKFQHEIGYLSQKTSEIIGGWVDDYSDDWVCDAIDEAVKNNVRKPAYIDAILIRWKNEGKNNGKADKPYIPEEHASEVY